MPKCEHCGNEVTTCQTIKAIEYFANGKVKRVEFKTAPDYVPLYTQTEALPHNPLYGTWPHYTSDPCATHHLTTGITGSYIDSKHRPPYIPPTGTFAT